LSPATAGRRKDAAGQSRGRVSRATRTAQRAATAYRLGPWTAPVLVLLGLLVALALGVPVGSAAYWWARGTNEPFQGISR
jgi:iron(III) transport system permease protein